MSVRFLRRKQVVIATGKPPSTIYQDMRDGLFPSSVSIGGAAVAWPAHEVELINAARLAGQTDDQVRRLVAQLESQRQRPWKQLSLFPELEEQTGQVS